MDKTLLSVLVGSLTTLLGAFFAGWYPYKRGLYNSRMERKRQVKAVLTVIERELVAENNSWLLVEQKGEFTGLTESSVAPASRVLAFEDKKLIGFDYLLVRGVADLVSRELIQDLMAVYLNLERTYRMMEKMYYENITEGGDELARKRVDDCAGMIKDKVLEATRKCYPQVESLLADVDAELKRGWWDRQKEILWG